MQVYSAIQKEQLIEAIDQYDLFPPKYKLILNTLIKIAVGSIATITVKELSRLCKTSSYVIYSAFEVFEVKEMIRVIRREDSKLIECILRPHKLNEILTFNAAPKGIQSNFTQQFERLLF